MLPSIGSVSALAGQGRVGVVVSAQPIGEEKDGRQLMALRIREGEQSQESRQKAAKPDAIAENRPNQAAATPKDASKAAPASPAAARLLNELSPSEKASVAELRQRDQQVRQEEKAHAAVAGDLAGPINYVYQLGPDGRQYAVGGSVGIKTSVTSGDPTDAKRQAGRLAAAANAATNPSAQDYAVARKAYALGGQLSQPATRSDPAQGVSLIS